MLRKINKLEELKNQKTNQLCGIGNKYFWRRKF